MAGIPRLTVESSAEQVECRDELITNILSRVSTRSLFKMSTVVKRWRTLIFDPGFLHTHYKNCHRESFFVYIDQSPVLRFVHSFHFRSHNPQTGNLSSVSLSLKSIDGFHFSRCARLVASSNGLMCFCTLVTFYTLAIPVKIPEFFVYNPVTKFLKVLPLPPALDKKSMTFPVLTGFCSLKHTGKLVIGGFSEDENDKYTLVFDSQSNSWYEGPPLALSSHYSRPRGSSSSYTVFVNGVIYFIVRTRVTAAQEGHEATYAEGLFTDEDGQFHKIIGYDVNPNQWCFSVFIPTSVGYSYCLFEWEGKLLVLASNSTHEENQTNGNDKGDGHFVFWILDTEQKRWTRDRELDLSHVIYDSWEVFASGGVVWLVTGYDSVIVYHMRTGHCSTHRLDDGHVWEKPKNIPCVAFEPTLLSF